MLKKISLLLLTAFVFTFLYLNVSIKLDILQKPLKKAISGTPFSDVKFGNVYFKFFNRISINNISLGKDFYCKELVIFIDPIILVKNIKNPEKALSQFLIDNGNLKLTSKFIKKFNYLSSFNGSAGQNIKIILKNIELSFENYKLTDLNGSIKIDKNVYGSISGQLEDKRFTIDAIISKEKESHKAEISLGISGNNMEVKSLLEALISSDGKINLVARTPKLQWQNISFDNSVLKMIYFNSSYEIKLMNKECGIYAEKKLPEDFKLKADLKLDSMISGASGKINFNFEKSKNAIKGDFYGLNIYYLKNLIGDISFSLKTNPNHSITGKGKMDNPGYIFETISKNLNEFNIKAKSKGKGLAELKGTFLPLSFIIKVSKWPLENMPILSSYYPGIKGEINAETEISENISRIKIFADDLVLKGNKIPSFKLGLFESKGDWFYKINSFDRSFNVSGKKMKSSYWNINAYLNGIALRNLFLLADLPNNINGQIYGKIVYDSNSNGYARIRLKNVSYLDYTCDSAKIFVDMGSEYFDIGYFSLHSGKGTITGNAFIGLNPYWGSSSSNILFYKFPLKNRIINGKIGIKGNIFSEKDVHFIGNINGSAIKIDNWAADNLKALVDVTKESIDVKSFKIDETLNGKIYINIFKKYLKGIFSFTSFTINGIFNDFKGSFNGNLSLKGSFENPNIDFTF
ncbi:MAG: hypothetical protein NT145_01835, partial [Elusimicrobia bacterium]|nr:hypothetical protein [Elusimicrobiota bacterium]